MDTSVIDDMKNFKNDKSQLLKQIDGLDNSSDKMIEDVMNNQDDIKKKQKDISNLISDLSQAEKTLNEEPKTPKIDKDKGEEFTTLSTNLDDQVSKLSERSTSYYLMYKILNLMQIKLVES